MNFLANSTLSIGVHISTETYLILNSYKDHNKNSSFEQKQHLFGFQRIPGKEGGRTYDL